MTELERLLQEDNKIRDFLNEVGQNIRSIDEKDFRRELNLIIYGYTIDGEDW